MSQQATQSLAEEQVEAPPAPSGRAFVVEPPGPLQRRLPGLAIFLATGGILLVAWLLEPSGAGPRALGTHTQIGMSGCGFEQQTGLPCATCGMTTAFALAADGRLYDAFITQPGGFILALMTAMVCWMGLWWTVTGRSLAGVFGAVLRPRFFLVLGGVVLGAWAYKIAGCLGWLG